MLLFMGGTASATVTLEVYFENGEIPEGALAALVADTAGDGFFVLSDVAVSGTSLSQGARIGGGDDQIIALLNANGGPEWASGTGIADTIAGIDYEALGIAAGTDLALYVFPDLGSSDGFFILGDRYVVYRSTVPGGSGGDIPFEAPADGGVYTLAAISPASGGDFNPLSPDPEETYETGNAGSEGTGLPDDHGNSREDATPVTEGILPGEIAPGDLDFFRITLTNLSSVNARTGGGALTQGWLFDSNGNVLSSPRVGETLALSKVLLPGTYFLGLRGNGNAQTGAYALNLETRELEDFRPDLTLGKSMPAQRGNDLYSSTGVEQRYEALLMKGRRVRGYFTVGNDGGLESEIAIRASRGSRFCTVNYHRLTGGIENITSDTISRGYFTEFLPLTSRVYQIDMAPTKAGRKTRRGGPFVIDASSSGLLDRGVVSLKLK